MIVMLNVSNYYTLPSTLDPKDYCDTQTEDVINNRFLIGRQVFVLPIEKFVAKKEKYERVLEAFFTAGAHNPRERLSHTYDRRQGGNALRYGVP